MSNKVLITSDWHIRSTVPSCVEATPSEWMDIQKQALDKIINIAVKHRVKGIYQCGDIFHSEQTASTECIQLVQDFALKCFDNKIDFFILAGNHDLPQHASENLYRSAMGVLFKSKAVKNMAESNMIKGCNFDIEDYGDAENIAKHVLCIPKENKPDFVECETPETLLEKFPHAKRIFLGDYHRNFYFEKDGRIVVNPGCLTRQASDFEDYVTGVYVCDLEDFMPDDDYFIPINIDQKFNHNGQEKKELSQELQDFVSGIKKENISLDYVASLKNESMNHEEPVQNKINEWIEKSGN